MPKLFGMEVSDETYNLNRHHETKPAGDKSTQRKDLDAEIRRNFAATFEANWRLVGGPPLTQEYKFFEERNWRNDYLHEPTMTIIELEGGVYTGGRHVRPKGFIDDCVKYNEVAMTGHRLIRIPTGMATQNYLRRIVEWLEEVAQ